MSDIRERGYYPDSVAQDQQALTITLIDDQGDERVFPAEFAVCPVCHGVGKYVNPSIDSHGISPEEFDEDPDFREQYMSGTYDVTCESCHGNRVMLVPTTDEGKRVLASVLAEEASYRAECEAERRMGA